MRALKGILHWLPRVLAAVFVVLAIVIGTGVMNARIVLSNSMEPHFFKNDLVIGASWLEPHPGDIAIYQERDINGKIQQDVVHRIVTVSQAGEYMFKGDNNESPDALMVARSDVKSVIVLKIPAIGGLFNPVGAFATVGVIGGIWALGFGILSLKRNKHTADEE
jgi:signal peptidase I